MGWIARGWLALGGIIAGWFVAKDAGNYPVISFVAGMLLFILFVAFLAFRETIVSKIKAIWLAIIGKGRSE